MLKVISADLSAVICSVEKQIFSANPSFEYLGSAKDANSLIEKSTTLHPDLVICSSDIPDLKNAIRIISKELKTQIVILTVNSSDKINLTGILEIPKPNFISMSPKESGDFVLDLQKKCFTTNLLKKEKTEKDSSYEPFSISGKEDFKILLVGVSTGGPKSVQTLLESLGENFPLPILITQHIDTTFDKNMVSWLNKAVNIPSALAEDREILKKGHAYFAPADCHLTLNVEKNDVLIKLDKSAPINFLRPAVDKMFESAASVFGSGCLGVLLTGMGSDGTEGCRKIKNAGGYTLGESEETCVVFGMPKSAQDAGVIDEMLPLYEIGKRIKVLLKRRRK